MYYVVRSMMALVLLGAVDAAWAADGSILYTPGSGGINGAVIGPGNSKGYPGVVLGDGTNPDTQKASVNSSGQLAIANTPSAGTGAAPSGSTRIATGSIYQTLFPASGISHGCYIQNPTSNTTSLYVDWTGATGGSLAATSQQIAPGSSVSCAFIPSNAVTVFATYPISFIAGQF